MHGSGANTNRDFAVGSAPRLQALRESQPRRTRRLHAPATSPTGDEIATAENNHDFAALLTVSDNCSEQVRTFASDYASRTIQFDGSIDAVGPHGDYDTRYDFLISAGDFSKTSSSGGPAFQIRDAGTRDLHLTGDEVPEAVGVKDDLRITAEVDRYFPEQCLLLLEPVEITVR